MRIELPPELAKRLQEKMTALGYPSRERLLSDALDALDALEAQCDTNGKWGEKKSSSASILKIFEEARRHIPEEELAALPSDGASQHDHYIYGLPKRPE